MECSHAMRKTGALPPPKRQNKNKTENLFEAIFCLQCRHKPGRRLPAEDVAEFGVVLLVVVEEVE